jgi:hypothetical protein
MLIAVHPHRSLLKKLPPLLRSAETGIYYAKQTDHSTVLQWKYKPTLLNGTPVAVEMEVTVHFSLGS